MLASYPAAQEGGERAPGTHCLHMHLISQISGKIVYFSNLPLSHGAKVKDIMNMAHNTLPSRNYNAA